MRSFRLSILVLGIVGFAVGAGSCASTDSSAGPTAALVAQTQHAIVGGSPTSAHPGVGAMTVVYPGSGYAGSFCTGTLIGARWVLTAAHCIRSTEFGIDLEQYPEVMRFMIGTNANPASPSGPIDGTLYPVDAAYVYPSYNSQTNEGDIALVHLASAAPSSYVIDYNTSSMSNAAWQGYAMTYVGYGVNDGINQTGSGIKRTGTIPVYVVQSWNYMSDATGGVGVCFGDSGGPGLAQLGGTWRVMGINSTVGSNSGDPCLGYGNHTRVDVYASWVAGVMGTPPPNCQSDPSVCQCAAACQSNGSCNNAACQTLDCEGIGNCMDGCPQNDEGCAVDCYYQGTDAGRTAFDTLQQCIAAHCQNAADMSTCIGQNCMTEYWGCFPPSNCDITGGDCPAGEACFPADSTHTDCYPSNGKAENAACDPNLTTALDCADGLVCVTFGSSGSFCVPLCTGDGDCGAGDVCYMPIFQDISDIGVCVCENADNDNACAVDDCDDNDPQTYPGATEQCGDGKDNDCDGQVDEGCSSCTDADQDGYCADVDCDDANAAVNPGATERCGDGKDNDCDGQVDEGCSSCTDADQDGYCADVDCDDANAAVNPGATERCWDNLDNDCDGIQDEECGGCTDADQDGYCAEVDCDDNDPNTGAGSVEQCGDGVDNDCDGQVDEGCNGCRDADQDGYCAAAECDDNNPYANPGMTEQCGDGVDNDCDGQVDEGCPTGGGKSGGCNAAATAPGPLLPSLILVLFGFLWRRRSP